MNKKRLTIGLCLMVVATSALASGSISRMPGVRSMITYMSASQPETGASPGRAGAEPRGESFVPRIAPALLPTSAAAKPAQGAEPPVEAIYGILFREVTLFKKEAKLLKAKGKPSDSIRLHHKNKYKLDDAKDKVLERIAAQADAEAAVVDRKAKQVINEVRARNPKGVVRPGERLPMPPVQLMTLQQERDRTILNAREQLRLTLGDHDFQQFDEAVKQEIGRKMRPVLNAPQRRLQEPRPGQPRQ